MKNLIEETLKRSLADCDREGLIRKISKVCAAPPALIDRVVDEYLEDREDEGCLFDDQVPVILGRYSNIIVFDDLASCGLPSTALSLDLAWKLSDYLDNVFVIHPIGELHRSVWLGNDGPYEKEFIFTPERHPLVHINLDEFRQDVFNQRSKFFGKGKGVLSSKTSTYELFLSLSVAYFTLKNIENIRSTIDWCLSSREVDDSWSSDDAEGAAIFSYLRAYSQCLKNFRICSSDFYYSLFLERVKTLISVEQDKKTLDVLHKIISVDEIDEDHFRSLCWRSNQEDGYLDNHPFEELPRKRIKANKSATVLKFSR